MKEHTFAVCAYGQSPFLRECLESVTTQRGSKSNVFIATSTPSAWLDEISSQYHVPVYVNRGKSGIGYDWTFAYERATTPLVTIAHQDDVYCPDYSEDAITCMRSVPNPLIYFCDYGELRNDERVTDATNLRIKRILLAPLRGKRAANYRFVKRFPIRLGNAICCPSVCYSKEAIPEAPFDCSLRNALDWDCWERLSRKNGAFCYSPSVHMLHRIHEDSATSENIRDDTRAVEDIRMLERFWPKPVAHAIYKLYAHGMDSNQI